MRRIRGRWEARQASC